MYQAFELAGENREKNVAALTELGEKIKNLNEDIAEAKSDTLFLVVFM
mgnify:CR=1 FL=1